MLKKQTKISFLFLGLAVLSAILHNAVYALVGVEEPIFFSLTFVFAIAFIVSLIYSVFT